MKENEILKSYGTDYREMTVRLLEQAKLAALIPDGAHIAIKPNLVSPTPAMFGATTHPEIIEGILIYLHSHGINAEMCGIIEGSWVGDRTEEAFEYCDYNRLSEKYGVPLYDVQKLSWRERDCAGMPVKVCSALDNFDFLINVPVMKGHCQTKMTCALKNIKGLIPNMEKRHFHQMGLHNPIAHLNAGVKQNFIVVDHICGDLEFEDGGHPVICNCIMAARDPVLVDSYICSLLGLKTEEVPYIGIAEKLGVGNSDISRAAVQTLEGTEYEPGLKGRRVVGLETAVSEVESCSACYGSLIPALDRLRQEGLLDPLSFRETICIGQGYRGKSGRLGVGNCTRLFQHSVCGCPPDEEDIYSFLKAYLNSCIKD